jgi:anti-sigma factor RsiW
MTALRTIDESELHAYVDGEVAGARCAEIGAWLETHPAEARMVAEWRRHKQVIRDRFAPIADEAIPFNMAALLHRARPVRRWFAPGAVAAGLAVLVAGALAGWLLNDRFGASQAQSLADRALVAHEVYAVEVRHPVEVPASEREHLTSWLSKRLGKSLIIPDLAPQGYTFLGGRLLAAADRPAAQLMFEDTARKRLTLFLVADGNFGKSEFRIEEHGDVLTCYWIDGDFGFAIAGEVTREKAMELAEAIYDQFEKD